MIKNVLKNFIVSILVWEAKTVLARKKPKIVAVTGSVGKTSTKDAIYTVLKKHVYVRGSGKNYNSDIGASLTILGLRNAWDKPLLWIKTLIDGFFVAFFAKEYPEVLVLELGIDRPGDMKRLTSFIKPHIVVLTRLPDVPSHVEFFDSPQQVCEEKLLLVEALDTDGILIYNNDDELILEYVQENVRQQAFGYSRYSPSDFTASGDTVIYNGGFPESLSFTLSHAQQEVSMVVNHSLGVQHTYNYAAAAAVAQQFDISLQDAASALTECIPPAGRMRVIAGINNTLIIDDTYNSSPVAAEHALQTLAELKSKHRKIAVLGDMLELGKLSVEAHEHIGALAAQSADILITIGLRSRKTAEGALEHGMDEGSIFQYEDAKTAAQEIQTIVQSGDIVLVKGSQSIRAERVTKALMAYPQQAQELLPRQDAAWLQKQ